MLVPHGKPQVATMSSAALVRSCAQQDVWVLPVRRCGQHSSVHLVQTSLPSEPNQSNCWLLIGEYLVKVITE